MSRPEDRNGQNWFCSWLSLLGTNNTWLLIWVSPLDWGWGSSGRSSVGHSVGQDQGTGWLKKPVKAAEQTWAAEQTTELLESEQRGATGMVFGLLMPVSGALVLWYKTWSQVLELVGRRSRPEQLSRPERTWEQLKPAGSPSRTTQSRGDYQGGHILGVGKYKHKCKY